MVNPCFSAALTAHVAHVINCAALHEITSNAELVLPRVSALRVYSLPININQELIPDRSSMSTNELLNFTQPFLGSSTLAHAPVLRPSRLATGMNPLISRAYSCALFRERCMAFVRLTMGFAVFIYLPCILFYAESSYLTSLSSLTRVHRQFANRGRRVCCAGHLCALVKFLLLVFHLSLLESPPRMGRNEKHGARTTKSPAKCYLGRVCACRISFRAALKRFNNHV